MPFWDKEWIKKLWYIYTMGYYHAVKNNDIMRFFRQIDEEVT